MQKDKRGANQLFSNIMDTSTNHFHHYESHKKGITYKYTHRNAIHVNSFSKFPYIHTLTAYLFQTNAILKYMII